MVVPEVGPEGLGAPAPSHKQSRLRGHAAQQIRSQSLPSIAVAILRKHPLRKLGLRCMPHNTLPLWLHRTDVQGSATDGTRSRWPPSKCTKGCWVVQGLASGAPVQVRLDDPRGTIGH